MSHLNNAHRKAHFIGICGAGMSAVAQLLRDAGWQVSGSDAGFYPPVSEVLERAGLPCATPHDPANIPDDVNLIVVGKHAKLTPETNPEVARAFDLQAAGKARIQSFPEVLHTLTAHTTNLMVVGSYGKSTTTAILAWLLLQNGRDPSYLIGAVPVGFDSNAHTGASDLFVLEGDEYPSANWDTTSKFLYYNPRAVILTSGEHDHFNEFPTEADYVNRYRELVRTLPPDGLLVACAAGRNALEIASEARCRVVTYAAEPEADADWRTDAPETLPQGMRFTVVGPSEMFSVVTQLFGRHNQENLLGAIALLRSLALLTPEQIQAALPAFPGLRRRLEPKTVGTNVTVYEDLSSSFPKAKACLDAVRQKHSTARVFAVFQPHTFSFRSRQALAWYPGMFSDADAVLVFSPPNLQGLASEQELSHAEIVAAIQQGNPIPVQTVGSADETVAALSDALQPGDVVVLMTSGGMGGAIEPILALIQDRYRVAGP